jgi:serine/tyrosine/threonine adenylyltransferase
MFKQEAFESLFVASLPVDDSRKAGSRQVHNACASLVLPTPTAKPEVLAWSTDVGAMLGLAEPVSTDDRTETAHVLSGNLVLPGMVPFAACYGGHQFGNWAGQLGDGRAMSLTEIVNPKGERFEIQLKGAGPTPYSRGSDGRAVLRSSLREFICSEAMHHLGVPTTRALSLTLTGDKVVRDMFYDGNAAEELGAVVCRVAASFLRFGSFEIHRARGDVDTLKKLTDYTIRQFYSHLGEPSQDTYLRFLREVCERTALVIAHWMRVGFVHGVLNTDNMSILGLTIDYGPYGWLEPYDPGWTPNTTDAQGRRYRFGMQPQIGLWNVTRLGEALLPLIGDAARVASALGAYEAALTKHMSSMTRAKLGLLSDSSDDAALAQELFSLLEEGETDMTLFFRHLADVDVRDGLSFEERATPLRISSYGEQTAAHESRLQAWLTTYCERTRQYGEARALLMNQVNPLYVPRNYLAQVAIDAAEKGAFEELHALTQALKTPYVVQPGNERFAAKRPEWARHRPGSSMLSCSS